MNLTGQHQPSGLPDIRDSSLDDQILGGLVFTEEDLALHSALHNIDDIRNALIDTPMEQFSSFDSIITNIPASPPENDDITKLISSSFEEITRQSTIEDTMERMNLSQSQTDILASPTSVQIGSSPVEHKEIDNSILARQYVQQQERLYKNASKVKKNSKHQNSSSNVGPIYILSSYGACQPCTTAQMQNDFDDPQQILQFDSMDSKKIQLKSQPRSKFRPRTQNESRTASHYIRCEINNPHEYPTIYIPHIWALQSAKNIIEVSLVRKDGQPHPYTIDNKTCSTTFDDNALIFRQNDLNTLYFCVTEDDFKTGCKSFMVEYIKSKQDDIITKELIKARQLDQSMLRFTRIYQAEKNTYQRDETSTEYSCIMSEAYGDVGVEHMGPTYGPMCGNERVYSLLKGRILKDDITVFVTENRSGWHQQLIFTKNGNLIYFSMPPYPFPRNDSGVANITIYYKGEELYQSPYLYKSSLDQALSELNLNDPTSTVSDSSTSDAFDFFSATGACPVRISSRKSSTAKSTKRLNNK
ncbi:unnamed protein product [Rotaria sordida]|uniref:Uncharacterized protein n=1 Tax=Rotaria sordida TaxID=392033 RepID=A0A818VFS4_9BILA|nr:unnamed protein product [Rotaria sordida]CAF0907787.1 unnamed protein product [Rotaria sordida]CAF0925249.1 unnamed protein product [Rotaria sordida]CAF1037068.1 unnamed protein product [Rotaria sordida]CAF3655618.1 unnamed protein product [Rotaria sordida]